MPNVPVLSGQSSVRETKVALVHIAGSGSSSDKYKYGGGDPAAQKVFYLNA